MAQIKFYAEKHISKAVTNQLQARGVDILRSEDVGLTHASDPEHLEYAFKEGRVLITFDQDFLGIHDEWQLAGKQHAGIVFAQAHLQRPIYVGRIVEAIFEFHELVAGGAATVENDFYNQRLFIS